MLRLASILDNMLDPRHVLDRLGGIARGVTLQQYGLPRQHLAKAVRAGLILRLRPGLYASPDAVADTCTASLHGGALTCSQALRAHGIWVLSTDEREHVWVGRRGRVHAHGGCRCVSHFFRGRVPIGIVDVETALIHLYRCEGDEAFFASFESALHERRLSPGAVLRIRAALPSSARWLVDLAGPTSESGLESILRLRLHLIGLALTAQVLITGVGRVDFVIDGRLILEADGRLNHDGPSMRHKDLTRDAAASALGYETLHFDYAQIIHDWPVVQAAILAAVARLRDRA
ncbi:type IV toxin-antitoxin system AbiEi family antitoxin domain-containing protein [Microbacterium sp. NPDC055903]